MGLGAAAQRAGRPAAACHLRAAHRPRPPAHHPLPSTHCSMRRGRRTRKTTAGPGRCGNGPWASRTPIPACGSSMQRWRCAAALSTTPATCGTGRCRCCPEWTRWGLVFVGRSGSTLPPVGGWVGGAREGGTSCGPGQSVCLGRRRPCIFLTVVNPQPDPNPTAVVQVCAHGGDAGQRARRPGRV